MLPCPICGGDPTGGKWLPKSKKLDEYRQALGVPHTTFQDIETQRLICLSHFDENQFYSYDGKKTLRKDALPRRLSDEERSKIMNSSRFRRFKPSFTPMPSSSSAMIPHCSSEADTNNETMDQDYDFEVQDVRYANDDAEESEHQGKYKYVVVSMNQLMLLLERCSKCGHKPKNNAKTVLNFVGTACKSSLWCQNCKEYNKWESQKRLPNSQRYEGNVDVAIAATLVPISYPSLKQYADLMDMPMIHKATFYRITPTVWQQVEKAYKEMQDNTVNRLLQREKVHLAADGQYDSRGYSAYLCSVTFMDVDSGLIVTTVSLDKRIENCPSTELEKKGVEAGLNELLERNVPIYSLTTDRSKTVIALMQKKFDFIIHWYDLWHTIKGKAHELRLESKLKRGLALKPWCQAILNHVWWSVKVANGDQKKCAQFVISVLLHIIGVHSWTTGPILKVLHNKQAAVKNVHWKKNLANDPYELQGDIIKKLKFEEHKECGHAEPSLKAALDPASKTYGVLQKSFTTDNFLHDIQNSSPHCATSSIESFHSLKSNKYCTKNYYFNLKGFDWRTKLAILHHNHNILDVESGKRRVVGTKKYRYRAKHRDGDFMTKERKSPPDFSWKKIIASNSRNNIPSMSSKNVTADEADISDISDTEDANLPPSTGNIRGMILNEWNLENEESESEEE